MIDAVRKTLATRRLVRLVVKDKISEDARVWLCDRWPPEDHKITYLLTCETCVTVWAAAAISSGLVPKWVIDTLALSEAAELAGEGVSRWVSET